MKHLAFIGWNEMDWVDSFHKIVETEINNVVKRQLKLLPHMLYLPLMTESYAPRRSTKLCEGYREAIFIAISIRSHKLEHSPPCSITARWVSTDVSRPTSQISTGSKCSHP